MRGKWKKICYIKTGNGIIKHMVKNQLRHAYKAKTAEKEKKYITYLKVEWSIKRWPCVHSDYLVVQLGLG